LFWALHITIPLQFATHALAGTLPSGATPNAAPVCLEFWIHAWTRPVLGNHPDLPWGGDSSNVPVTRVMRALDLGDRYHDENFVILVNTLNALKMKVHTSCFLYVLQG
jgi:hypothetical protein